MKHGLFFFLISPEWPPSNECRNPQSVPLSTPAQPASLGYDHGPSYPASLTAHDEPAYCLHVHAVINNPCYGHDTCSHSSAPHKHKLHRQLSANNGKFGFSTNFFIVLFFCIA